MLLTTPACPRLRREVLAPGRCTDAGGKPFSTTSAPAILPEARTEWTSRYAVEKHRIRPHGSGEEPFATRVAAEIVKLAPEPVSAQPNQSTIAHSPHPPTCSQGFNQIREQRGSQRG